MKQKMGIRETLQAAREQEREFGTNGGFLRKYGKFFYLDIVIVVLALLAAGYLYAVLSALYLGISILASLAVALVIPLLYLGILYAFRNRSPTFGILREWLTRRRSP